MNNDHPWPRRDFVRASAVGLAGLSAGALPAQLLFGDDTKKNAENPMKLLILGGTRFLGPATVDAALARGHTITLFNRGRSNPHLYPKLEKLKGDRDGDLEALKGRQWDAVIDTSGYVPRLVKDSATLLAGNVQQYVFISSISVYADFPAKDVNESSPVARIDDTTVEKVDGRTYGPLKALCEEAAEAAFPGKTSNIRPGFIVGPGDGSDRFTYWPVRVARGGEMLCPGKPADTVQFIDVRDLGEWIIHCIEAKVCGVFNATGDPLPMGDLLDTCKKVSKADTRFTWVEQEFLEKHQAHLPIWIPPPDGSDRTTTTAIEKGRKQGLRFRPLADTVKATLEFSGSRPADHKWRSGLTAEREAELLRAWHDVQDSEG